MKRKRDKAFLAWCHTTSGACCLCGAPWEELHHFGSAGMGQRGSDREVARVCRRCHERYGRRIHALTRNGETDILEAYLRDAEELNGGYDGRQSTT